MHVFIQDFSILSVNWHLINGKNPDHYIMVFLIRTEDDQKV